MAKKVKIAISISEKHNNYLIMASEDMGINKSAMVSVCIDYYLKNQEVIEAMAKYQRSEIQTK